ncbi:cysteine--tRNA ligase [Spiroplasma culicicola]|uniref:Cysteine--tRNA ligase n=1 Tax=Spiroplasma culicicola AES-1 TaxID=1276246 RepID=W6A5V6_9MOLU|nr:cysteine--tRNA ligase [Spiroplasma culicicola]AHI52372.1 cysteinyl-tRNA synthetase [Spiroplasma culicicola AES-1]
MKIYDSLSTEYKEIDVPKVCIYNCGPTVYNYIHIGNARPLILSDLVIRFLEYRNIKYKYLLNITDIDDKIIDRAEIEKIEEEELTKFYTKAFLDDLDGLNINRPTAIIPISERINEIIDFIDALINDEFAYEVDGNVYFDVNKMENKYGNLSKQKLEELEVGNRVEEDLNKRNPFDFVLWKKTEKGKKWLSKWSLGRPGWHTECALLIDSFFKYPIDIHVGGIDLKFPHHENERIQYLAKNSREITNVWMHNGHLSIDNVKMSKSLNNTILVKDFIEEYGNNTLRYMFLNTNYKQPLNITKDLIEHSQEWCQKIQNILKQVNWMQRVGDISFNNQTPIDDDFNSYKYMTKFRTYFKDDLNTPMIITLIDEMSKNLNKQIRSKVVDLTYEKLIKILRVLGFKFEIKDIDNKTVKKITEWKKLVAEKNFEKADKLRDELKKENII